MSHFEDKSESVEASSRRSSNSSFQKLRQILWPIQNHELGKFIPMFLIFCILAFVYDMLRVLKSSLVVSASEFGVEIIPFIKVWALLPGAFLFTSIYLRLSHIYSRERTFYLMMSLFLGFFTLFLTVIYPWQQELELVTLSNALQSILPEGGRGFVGMLRYWPLTLFYVMTELWGCILLSMLFWGFANEVTKVSEAKRFYPFFLLGANAAAVFSGRVGVFFSEISFNPLIPYGQTAWDQSMAYFISVALGCGLLVVGLFWWMHQSSAVDLQEQAEAKQGSQKKIKLSVKDCLYYLAHSRHLLFIALMVLSYNIIFNLSDIMWTHQIKLKYNNDIAGMTSYLSQMTSMTGIVAFFISLLVTGNLLRRWGWRITALLTPIVIGVTGIGFFSLLLFGDSSFLSQFTENFGFSLQSAVIFMGSCQIVFSRGCKYTLFDTSKEIAYIPLSKDEQRYGKAAIDGIGSRLGKSGGSIIFQILFLFCSSVEQTTPFIASLIFLIILVWIVSVHRLSKWVD